MDERKITMTQPGTEMTQLAVMDDFLINAKRFVFENLSEATRTFLLSYEVGLRMPTNATLYEGLLRKIRSEGVTNWDREAFPILGIIERVFGVAALARRRVCHHFNLSKLPILATFSNFETTDTYWSTNGVQMYCILAILAILIERGIPADVQVASPTIFQEIATSSETSRSKLHIAPVNDDQPLSTADEQLCEYLANPFAEDDILPMLLRPYYAAEPSVTQLASFGSNAIVDSLGIMNAGFVEVFRYTPLMRVVSRKLTNAVAIFTPILILCPLCPPGTSLALAMLANMVFTPSSYYLADFTNLCFLSCGSNTYKIAVGNNFNKDNMYSSQSDLTRFLSAREEGPKWETCCCPISREWDLVFRDEQGVVQFTIKKRRYDTSPLVFIVHDSRDVKIGYVGMHDIKENGPKCLGNSLCYYDCCKGCCCCVAFKGCCENSSSNDCLKNCSSTVPIMDAKGDTLFQLRTVYCDCTNTVSFVNPGQLDDLGIRFRPYSGGCCHSVERPRMSAPSRTVVSQPGSKIEETEDQVPVGLCTIFAKAYRLEFSPDSSEKQRLLALAGLVYADFTNSHA